MENDIRIKTIKELKKEAREKLKGNWGIAILVSIIVMILTSLSSLTVQISRIFDFISGGINISYYNLQGARAGTDTSTLMISLGMLINLVVGGSFSFGLCKFFLSIVRKEKVQVEDVFSGFRYFGRNFLIQLVIGIFSFLWALVVCIPFIILGIIMTTAYSSANSFGFMTSVNPVGEIAAIVFVILICIGCNIIVYLIIAKYALAFYIYVDNTDLAVMDAINSSKEMMQGNRVRLVLLHLSFAGWHILAVLSFFIGYLWLTPYINTTVASFYENLKGNEQPATSMGDTISLEKENI